MKLVVFTLTLNSMPTLPAIFFSLNASKLDWRWIVAEGAASNTHCTKWCREQPPGLSQDGTTEFLNMISSHPNVTILRKEMWDGKIEMCQACVDQIKEPCLLLQCDSDELWTPEQLERIVEIFTIDNQAGSAQFICRYFLGVNIVSTAPNSYGNKTNSGEWLRAWRFTPGDVWISHEPPNLKQQFKGNRLNPDWLEIDGLVFDHYAYAFENQVAYKEQFYGYPNCLAHWRRLQSNTKWPVKLKDFLPWTDDRATADILT